MAKVLTPEETINIKSVLKDRLKYLSEEVLTLGDTMEFYGGFGEMGKKGKELKNVSEVAKSWLKEEW